MRGGACDVVLDRVAAAHDLARELRDGARALLGDAEERGARAVRLEQVEHARRDLGIGAVVEGERDLAARAAAAAAGA